MTAWDDAARIDLYFRAVGRRERVEKLADALRDLVYAVGDYADHTSALGPRRSIAVARAALAEWEQDQ